MRKAIIALLAVLSVLSVLSVASCSTMGDGALILGDWVPVKTQIYREGFLIEENEGVGLNATTEEKMMTFSRKYLTFTGLDSDVYGIYKYDAENGIISFVGDFYYTVETLTSEQLVLSTTNTTDEDETPLLYIYHYRRP